MKVKQITMTNGNGNFTPKLARDSELTITECNTYEGFMLVKQDGQTIYVNKTHIVSFEPEA